VDETESRGLRPLDVLERVCRTALQAGKIRYSSETRMGILWYRMVGARSKVSALYTTLERSTYADDVFATDTEKTTT
jgi:hypothetical protein